MHPMLIIWSITAYVESRIRQKIDYSDLAASIGLSLPHLREVFRNATGKPLARYITERKVLNAAYQMLITQETALSIATEFGFGSADTFTRAFRRVTGLNPRAFRSQRVPMGRVKLCGGVFGVGLLLPGEEKLND